MRCGSVRVVSLIVLLTLALAGTASAKELVSNGGMEPRVFRSAVDNKGHFTVEATPILPHLNISVGLMLDFGFNQWVAANADGTVDDSNSVYGATEINNYSYTSLMFNLGLFDMFVVGLQVPISFITATAFTEDGADQGWGSNGGIGDIGLHVKMRWLRADRRPVGLGTVVQYMIPSGNTNKLQGDPGGGTAVVNMIVDTEPTPTYRAAANIGVRLPFGAMGAPSSNLQSNFGFEDGSTVSLFNYGPMLTFGAGNSWSFLPGLMDLVVEFYGNRVLANWGNSRYTSLEANIGLKIYVERNSYLVAGYAHGIPIGSGPEYGFQSVENRAFVGFAYEPSIGDRDLDSIKDDLDQCPDSPEDHDGFLDSDGCPELDNDRDGVPDTIDQCPMVPEDHDGIQDEDGCPERSALDRDGDGINDNEDQCPDDPEDLDQFEDANGCPDTDNDQDKILDINDKCPDKPEDYDGFEDDNGCPDVDNDQDRILDVDDQCPNEPEMYNGIEDEDGCDDGDIKLSDTGIQIPRKIFFEYDSAKIKEVSHEMLLQVADVINFNPQVEIVEIAGHADERGDDEYNLELTAERAKSVMKFLIRKGGVAERKLRSIGYGEYCPKDPGHTEAAWEQNRRVEFIVLVNNGELTGAERGCDTAASHGIVSLDPKIQD